MPNVLLIAPASDLPAVQNEIRNVSLALRPAVLQNKVVGQEVLHWLTAHPWDIVIFATHGDEHGIVLSDGQLPIGLLAPEVRASGAYLIILNTCASEIAGSIIHNETGATVICTIGPIDDAQAAHTMSLLARNLAAGLDPATAYERSKPSLGSLYRIFTGSPLPPGSAGNVTPDEIRQAIHRFAAKLDAIDSKVENLADRVAGLEQRMESNLAMLQTSTQARISDLARRTDVRIATLSRTLTAIYRQRMTPARGALWLLGFTLFYLGLRIRGETLFSVFGWHRGEAEAIGLLLVLFSIPAFLLGLGYYRRPQQEEEIAIIEASARADASHRDSTGSV